MDYKEFSGIWVFAQHENGAIEPTVYELLAKSQELKETLNEEITAVIVGDEDISTFSGDLISHGADKVIELQSVNLKEYSPRTYEKALVKACGKHKPSIFLFGATAQGRDLAPRVMCTLRTGLTADAVELGFDEEGSFVQITPAFGGQLMTYISIPEKRPQMVTVRPHVFSANAADDERKGEVINYKVDIEADDCYEVLEKIPKEKVGKPISEAEIIVSGGRGIKKKEDLEMLNELADLLDGQLACSRPLVDIGWLDHSLQIGQSGTTVKPKYIFNFAVSGSVQYIVGMEKAETILTVNTYDRAGLFSISHYGAIADYQQLLPAVIAEIKRRKQIG